MSREDGESDIIPSFKHLLKCCLLERERDQQEISVRVYKYYGKDKNFSLGGTQEEHSTQPWWIKEELILKWNNI